MREASEETEGKEPKVLDSWTERLFQLVESSTDDSSSLEAHVHSGCPHIDSPNLAGETGLIAAARLGNLHALRLFVERGADVNAFDDDCFSALLNAAQRGDRDAAEFLLDARADHEEADAFGWTPLAWAAYKDNVDVLHLLVQRGADLNAMDEDGLTPLALAAGRGLEEAVEALLEAKAVVNVFDKFGSSPLVWAARRGFTEVVRRLLQAGADIDHPGMGSATPLILATRGNFTDTVDELLKCEPNVNAKDRSGVTALWLAGREGYVEVAEALVEAGAHVNVVDSAGDSVLLSAVKAGNLPIIRLLLLHYADIDLKDSEGRTALFCAVDRGYVDIVELILANRPHLELRSAHGDTALLRAVRNRHLVLTQLLMNAGAKVSTADPAGDNPLHLSLRSRSKRLTQVLLARPKDARLLYRPNGSGETPYSIDQSSSRPILPHIFGPMESQAETEAMMGYDIYSNIIADILCEPNLSLPITAGLYAKWGSGKSFLLNKMKESLRAFSRSWLDEVELAWQWRRLLYLAMLALFVGVAVYGLGSRSASNWLPPVLSALAVWLALSLLYGLAYYGTQVKAWAWAAGIGGGLARSLARMRLLYQVLFYQPPTLRDKDLLACPVSFLTADYHRLSSVGGEQALGNILTSFYEAAEAHYGHLVTRLAGAVSAPHTRSAHRRLRTQCGCPILLAAVGTALTAALSLLLLAFYFHSRRQLAEDSAAEAMSASQSEEEDDDFDPEDFDSHTGALVLGLMMAGVSLLAWVYPVCLVLHRLLVSSPRRKIASALDNLDHIKFEGLMQELQGQVEKLGEMVLALDAFTRSQTRLVVFVDGLDNCEQERMVVTLDALELLFASRRPSPFAMVSRDNCEQERMVVTLDALELLFASRRPSPFAMVSRDKCEQERIVVTLDALELLFASRRPSPFAMVIAVDPHIIISAVDQNLAAVTLPGTQLTGHHYLKNIVNLPFYLQNAGLRRLQEKLRNRREDIGEWKARFLRQDTLFGSYMSLREESGAPRLRRGPSQALANTAATLAQTIVKDDYFSNINPRSMNRIINTLNLTGRLMRAFEMEVRWVQVAHWVALVEQWPYRMSWLIHLVEEDMALPPTMPLYTLYRKMKGRIPSMRSDDPLVEMDRNPENLEFHLASTSPQLLVSHLQELVPCTSNLDPYIRKLIKEREIRGGSDGPLGISALGQDEAEDSRRRSLHLLFEEGGVPEPLPHLPSLTPEQVAKLVGALRMTSSHKAKYSQAVVGSNLSGLVLSLCDLDALRSELDMSLGDWTLLKLLLEILRSVPPPAPATPSLPPQPSSPASVSGLAEVRQRRPLPIAQPEWLQDRLQRLDTAEFAGDRDLDERLSLVSERSHRSSVRFAPDSRTNSIQPPVGSKSHSRADEDEAKEEEASSCDSTTSMFGSAENLLALVPSGATRFVRRGTRSSSRHKSGQTGQAQPSPKNSEDQTLPSSPLALLHLSPTKSLDRKGPEEEWLLVEEGPPLSPKPSTSAAPVDDGSSDEATKPTLPRSPRRGEMKRESSVSSQAVTESDVDENQITVKLREGASETARPSAFDLFDHKTDQDGEESGPE